MVVHLLLWSLADSKTTLDELRAQLPKLEQRDTWLSNEASERFGLVSFGDEPPAELARVRDLIGRDPEVAEEFDVEA